MAGRAAVVIGINYEQQTASGSTRASLTRLRFAEADARDVAAELTAAGYAELEQGGHGVTLLLGVAATREAITEAIVAARRAVGPEGLLVLHFSGHGDVDPDDEETAYLLPVDTNPDKLLATAIPLTALVQHYLGRVQTAIALLDCCHSGWALGFRGAGDRGAPFRRQATVAAAQGRVVVAACPGDDLAREAVDLGHGVFTHFVLDHWRTYSGAVTAESLTLAAKAGLQARGLPLPVWGGTSQVSELRPALALAPPPAQAPTGLSKAEMKRRERLYTTLQGFSEARWAALLAALGEDAGAYGGARAVAARRLVEKLEREGLLKVLTAEAARVVATEQQAEQAAEAEARQVAAAQQAAKLAAQVEEQRLIEMQQAMALAAQLPDLIQQFEAAEARQDWYAAMRSGELILKIGHQEVNIHTRLAAAYYEQSGVFWRNGEYDYAVAALKRATELVPQNAAYYLVLGAAYHEQSTYKRAIATYTQAIEIDPRSGDSYYFRALSYRLDGDQQKARDDFEKAVELGYEPARSELTQL